MCIINGGCIAALITDKPLNVPRYTHSPNFEQMLSELWQKQTAKSLPIFRI